MINIKSVLSIEGGFKLIYERDASLDIRITDPRIIAMVGQDVGSREGVTFKILYSGHSEENPDLIKLEVSSDHDYYFLYRHV